MCQNRPKKKGSYHGPCIVYRDLRPRNILILDGKVNGIIDFVRCKIWI
ncbi:MAG: hypothetical protein EBU93_01735 [Chlamydiae bacterium]|nr:hypothetical protein [Chlamydiota bacterium]